MAELASLGTSIPGPALAPCIAAVLCVKLGNFYGTSRAAQPAPDKVLSGLSKERWIYYFNERLEEDRLVLSKFQDDRPLSNWISIIGRLKIEPTALSGKNVRALIRATNDGDKARVQTIGNLMFQESVR